MAPIIERFKGLMGLNSEKWYETGRKDGLAWARSRATRNELEYAATRFKTQKERGKLVSYNPAKVEEVGPVFVGAFEKYRFSWEETEPYTHVPGRRYQEWEQGFADSVREYWEQIQR